MLITLLVAVAVAVMLAALLLVVVLMLALVLAEARAWERALAPSGCRIRGMALFFYFFILFFENLELTG